MKNLQFINKIAQQVIDKLPESVKVLKSDVDKTIHQVLTHSLSKLNLVTREEFDAQMKVLARTRQKVEMLETQLAILEKAQQNNDR